MTSCFCRWPTSWRQADHSRLPLPRPSLLPSLRLVPCPRHLRQPPPVTGRGRLNPSPPHGSGEHPANPPQQLPHDPRHTSSGSVAVVAGTSKPNANAGIDRPSCLRCPLLLLCFSSFARSQCPGWSCLLHQVEPSVFLFEAAFADALPGQAGSAASAGCCLHPLTEVTRCVVS